jgi:asparagine N-glycosylation enzyme membrane subunit Stt3
LGLTNSWDALLVLLALGTLAVAWQEGKAGHGRRRPWLLAGIAVGLNAYTFTASRLLPLLLIMLLVQIPLIAFRDEFPANLFLFSLIAIGQPILFVLGQQVLYPDWLHRLRHFPTLLVVAIGLAPSNSRAILQAVFNRDHVFVRTPKTGMSGTKRPYRLPFDWIVVMETGLALYALAGAALAIYLHNWGPLFFLLMCTAGFGYVAFLSLRDLWGA